MGVEADRCIEELEKLGERVVRTIVFEVTALLVRNTPVDTGWARANWIPSVGAPNATARTNRPTASLVPGAAAEQAAGLASLAAFKFGQTAYIVNNVPYIRKLNAGSSTQAPSGFVDRSVEQGVKDAARSLAT